MSSTITSQSTCGVRRAMTGAVVAVAALVTAACLPSTPSPPTRPAPIPTTTVAPPPTVPPTPSPGGTSPRFAVTTAPLGELWVDPVGGSDAATGASRTTALRTLAEAWRRIPASQALTNGVRVQITTGELAESAIPNYLEHRWGTASAPVVFNSVDGPGRARLLGDLNVFDVRHLYLTGLTIDSPGDSFHCERCDHLLLRQVTMDSNGGWETVKVNQSSNVFIEDSVLTGAGDNVVDLVAVHTGHIVGSVISDAGDWCAYVKGGSSRIVVDGNEIHDCGNGGFVAGQGTGFEFMTAPWLRHEAYDVVVTNNVVHHTTGAALGVNGAAGVLVAHNTAYRTGSRSHALEVYLGARSCDGDTAGCAANRALGGWGGPSLDGQWIPNDTVSFLNNLVVNPLGSASPWGQVAVQGAADAPSGSGVPAGRNADDGLRITGNVFANGGNSMSVVDGPGCNRPTCNDTLLRATNRLTGPDSLLVAPESGDWRPIGGAVSGGVTIAFTWPEREPGTGTWTPPSTWTTTRTGAARTGDRPGAL